MVALGGGAALDTGKVVAFMAGQTRPLWDFEDIGDWWTRADPAGIAAIVAIPTTAGTGSETTGVAIFDLTKMHAKTGIANRRLKPTLGILDPDNTRSMPAQVAASSGLDILSHAIESYTALLYAERALRAGGLGYIMKDEAFEQVLTAIRQVLKGEIFLSDKMKGRMLQQVAFGRTKAVSSPIETLTDRELEVFRLIGQGHGTRQIAEELHLSVRTVEAYREYIKEKLNLKNATELVQHAFHWVHHQEAA